MDYELPAVGQLSTEWVDLLIVMGSIGLVLLVAFCWALFFRRNVKRRIRRRKRRRSLNPTLAETGGMPPIREEKKPGAPAPPP
jgi:hypothetical protein